MRLAFLTLAFAAGAGAASADEVRLDKLNACDDMAKVVRQLNAGIASGAHDCRAPSSEAERRVTQSYPAPAYGGPEVCVLNTAPAPMLSGYSCIVATKLGKSAALTCFRQIGAEVLDAYRRDYRTVYATKAKSYLAEAR